MAVPRELPHLDREDFFLPDSPQLKVNHPPTLMKGHTVSNVLQQIHTLLDTADEDGIDIAIGVSWQFAASLTLGASNRPETEEDLREMLGEQVDEMIGMTKDTASAIEIGEILTASFVTDNAHCTPAPASAKVMEALRHVRAVHPEVVQVFYGIDGTWRYMDSEGNAPEFSEFEEPPIDISLLETAAAAAAEDKGLPCAYALDAAELATPNREPGAALSEQDLTSLGYEINDDPDQPGRFYWRNDQEFSEISYDTRAETMAAASRDAQATYELHRCDNCGKLHSSEMLQEIQDYAMRVTPGSMAPSGECEDCGALCYPLAAE